MVGEAAPPSATAGKGDGAAGFGPGHLSLHCPYLLLTSVLYMTQANTKIITTPTAMKGCTAPLVLQPDPHLVTGNAKLFPHSI